MIKVLLGLGTKTTWVGVGKDCGLGSDKFLVKVRGPLSSWL